MTPERRAARRERIELLLTLGDGSTALTRNISSRGLYITAEPSTQLDPWLLIEYESPETGLRFAAAGEVLRVEPRPREVGLAIRLHSPRVLPLAQ